MTKPSPFNLTRLRANLKPFRLHWFPRLRSTNDHAAVLRRTNRLFAPAAVLTAHQIAGRGRGANTWWSNPGVLTVTFALPTRDRIPPQELPLIAGLAVREIAAQFTGKSHILLKWPNDILHDNQKLAGLLCERVNNVDLIGVGLNVNIDPDESPRSLQRQMTSLLCIAGKSFDMNDVLIALAARLHHDMRRRMEAPFSTFVREYSRHDALAGKSVIITGAPGEPAITGRCEGVDHFGRLMVRHRAKLHTIVAGTVAIASPTSGAGA
ncbi:MAG TPA: biotin--[acetyl-CoA-carboxylase] ligase [Tepidisphaeraceae bacterium]|jgi:BirA family biotin operon repressor/biotin-[acetyl-CoA-carboxylase] ligase|nr:biotin--[acetyl-CoA-carboxylase] ligase [Tepidisphaeraceae bacterium]